MAKVLEVGFDGALFRLVGDEKTDRGWTEVWRGPESGWVKSGEPAGRVMAMPPASEARLKMLGVPLDGTREGDVVGQTDPGPSEPAC